MKNLILAAFVVFVAFGVFVSGLVALYAVNVGALDTLPQAWQGLTAACGMSLCCLSLVMPFVCGK